MPPGVPCPPLASAAPAAGPAKPKRQVLHPKKTKWGRVPADITHEELQEQFHLPMEHAAQRMGLGLTVLKQICRKYGISRWPFRKVLQLRRMAAVAKDYGSIMPLIMELQVPLHSRMWSNFEGKGKDRVHKALQMLRDNPEKQRQIAQQVAAKAAAKDEGSDGEDDGDGDGEAGSSPLATHNVTSPTTGKPKVKAEPEEPLEPVSAPPGGPLRVQVPKARAEATGLSPCSLGLTPVSSGLLGSQGRDGSNSLPAGCRFPSLHSPPLLMQSPHSLLPSTYSLNSDDGLDSVAGSMGPMGVLGFDGAGLDSPFAVASLTPARVSMTHDQHFGRELNFSGAVTLPPDDGSSPSTLPGIPLQEAALSPEGQVAIDQHVPVLHGIPTDNTVFGLSVFAGPVPPTALPGMTGVREGDSSSCALTATGHMVPNPGTQHCGDGILTGASANTAVHVHVTAGNPARTLQGRPQPSAELAMPSSQPSTSFSSLGRGSHTTTAGQQMPAERSPPQQMQSFQAAMATAMGSGTLPAAPVADQLPSPADHLPSLGPSVDDVLDEHLANLEMPLFALSEFPELKEAWQRAMMCDTPKGLHRSKSEIPYLQSLRSHGDLDLQPLPPTHDLGGLAGAALDNNLLHSSQSTPALRNTVTQQVDVSCTPLPQPALQTLAAGQAAHPVLQRLNSTNTARLSMASQLQPSPAQVAVQACKQHQQRLLQQAQAQQQQGQPVVQQHVVLMPQPPRSHVVVQGGSTQQVAAVPQPLHVAVAAGYQASDLRQQAQNAQQLAQQTHQAQQLLQARQHASPAKLPSQLLQVADGMVVQGQAQYLPRYITSSTHAGLPLVQQVPHLGSTLQLMSSTSNMPLQYTFPGHHSPHVLLAQTTTVPLQQQGARSAQVHLPNSNAMDILPSVFTAQYEMQL